AVASAGRLARLTEKRQVERPVRSARRIMSYPTLITRAALEGSRKLTIGGLPRIARERLAMSTWEDIYTINVLTPADPVASAYHVLLAPLVTFTAGPCFPVPAVVLCAYWGKLAVDT